MIEQEMSAAALDAARALAEAFGLGDGVQPLDEWPIEQGDSVIAVRLGPDDLQLLLAVNDDVADRLSAAPDVLDAGIRTAATALETALRLTEPLTVLSIERSTVPAPSIIAGITDQGTLTAPVGLTGSIGGAPAVETAPPQAQAPQQPAQTPATPPAPTLHAVPTTQRPAPTVGVRPTWAK